MLHNPAVMRRPANRLAWTVAALALSVERFAGAEEPQPGSPKQECLIASELGQNERDEGKYRAARQDFLTCARDLCPRVVHELCAKWLRELDESAPSVIVDAKDGRGNDLADVRVTFDGAPLAAALNGRPLEVDAGEHVLRFERDGSEPVEQRLVLRAGERARIVGVTLVPTVATIPGEIPLVVGRELASRSPEPAVSPRYVAAGALGGVALVAAGIGAYFVIQTNRNGDQAAGLRRDLSPYACTHETSPTCRSLSDKVHAQHQDQAIATTLFVGTGVLSVGALASWFLWPDRRPRTSAWIVPMREGVAVEVAASFR
jgi:hypothetical protein